MAKNNPNRQELIDFINEIDQNLIKVDKIEDLSTGVHYLYLLHQVHPNVIKIGKVNLKAFHEHENVNNLKILALYLSEVRAPFTFEVHKAAARNYQENLNLLKNLYKYYYSSLGRGKSLEKEPKQQQQKAKVENKKPENKVVIRPPEKLNKSVPMKKYSPDNSGLKGIAQDSKTCMDQIKKILVVVSEEKIPENEAAEEKLLKIKKILGIEAPYSEQKKGKVNEALNYSIKCSASKTNMKKEEEFDQEKTDLKTKTEDKSKSNPRNPTYNNENKTDANKNGKAFDCEEIKQSVINKYGGKSNRKSVNSRRITGHQQKEFFGTEEEDGKYYESLLSPGSGKRMTSKRKSTHQKSENKNQLSQEKNQPVSSVKVIEKSSKKVISEMKLQPANTNEVEKESTEPENNKIENH